MNARDLLLAKLSGLDKEVFCVDAKGNGMRKRTGPELALVLKKRKGRKQVAALREFLERLERELGVGSSEVVIRNMKGIFQRYPEVDQDLEFVLVEWSVKKMTDEEVEAKLLGVSL